MKQLTLDTDKNIEPIQHRAQAGTRKINTPNKNESLTTICTRVYNEFLENRLFSSNRKKHNKKTLVTKTKTNGKRLKVIAEFYPYTNIKLTVRKRKEQLLIRMSDILSDAPEEVLNAAAHYIITRQLKVECDSKQRGIYRDYIYSSEIRARAKEMRKARASKKLVGSLGKFHNLEDCFNSINRKYFSGNLPKFELTWSPQRSRRRYGHFDADLNTIVISRSLDSKRTPKYIIEYILYHEILHWRYPTKYVNGRLNIHTSEFKHAEKAFEEFVSVEKWLKKG